MLFGVSEAIRSVIGTNRHNACRKSGVGGRFQQGTQI
jgi:hypothetical protein